MSRTVKSTLIPSSSAFWLINPESNAALCATRAASPQNSRNSGNASSIPGAFTTIESSMLVSSVMWYGIGRFGFTNVLYLSVIFLFTTFTAPISIIWLLFAPIPVVSRSNTTNSPLKSCPLSFWTVSIRSSTR